VVFSRIRPVTARFLILGALLALTSGCGEGVKPIHGKRAEPVRKKVKDDQFDQVKIGMTLEEAEEILGKGRGVEKESDRTAIQRSLAELRKSQPKVDWSGLSQAKWWKWSNDKRAIFLGFRNNKVAIMQRHALKDG
jgi:hypothetical protein